MTKILSYKYINLLARILIGIIALWIILLKLQDTNTESLILLKTTVSYQFVLIAFVLLFLNWGIEAFKWMYAIQSIQRIKFFNAFKLTITGITIGLITPNRIGEIPARALLLNNKEKLKELVVKTSVAAFSQLIITFLIGTIASCFVLNLFNIPANNVYTCLLLIVITFLFFIFYFSNTSVKKLFYTIPYFKKRKLLEALDSFKSYELIVILNLSGLRYLVFAAQYYFVLKAFGINLINTQELLLIPFCFLIASSIPTILISEIGVRGSVALFVFSIISDNNLAIFTASILLWLINVAVPALIGLLFLNRLKIVKEE